MKKIIILFCLLLSLFSQAQHSFQFTSDGVKRHSAGVFDSSGKLIRTLFSGKVFPANAYTFDWDGKDDEGHIAPSKKYFVRLLSNDVKYEWEGVIGNTSDSLTGPTVWRGYMLANGLTTVGSKVYVAQGYGEHMNSVYSFDVSAPNRKLPIFPTQKGIQLALANCSDSNYVYWAQWGYSASNMSKSCWLIYATRVSDNSEVNFSNGVTYTSLVGRTHSVIGLQDESMNPANAKPPTAMAVQRKGVYLFVSRKKGNRVDVYNKATGAFIRSLLYSKPTGLSIDRSDNLWMVTGDSIVTKYTILTDGRLSNPVISIKGLSQPQNVCVSYDGSYILVADCGASQQIKAFSNSTGAGLWALGTEGGYRNSSVVTNTRFMFSDITGVDEKSYYNIPAITFQGDGSFWFADNGNRRLMHFDAKQKFLNHVMYLGTTYFTKPVVGDVTRLICGNLEFSIDYSKPLAKGWALTHNYGYNASDLLYNGFAGIEYATKFPNGRTYGLYQRAGSLSYYYEIVELTTTGLRTTGELLYMYRRVAIVNDGSIILQTAKKYGEPVQLTRKALIGYDANGNPKYGAAVPYITTPSVSKGDPVHTVFQDFPVTDNGYYWFFDPSPKQEKGGYHLGAIPVGKSEWKVQTSKGTGVTYMGDFPDDGRFDDGNTVNAYAGSQVTAFGQHVIWGYHGEFWKQNQANKYNHFFEDGLFIGQFGVTHMDIGVKGVEAAPQMAGNALTPALVKGTDGHLYLYHGDESHHAGIHRWKLTGLNTIEEITIPLGKFTASTLDASFRVNKTIGCAPMMVEFTDESNAGTDSIASWFWDFGDGSTSTEQHPSHTYASPGDYTVSLKVASPSGCSKSFSRTQYVHVSEGPQVAILSDSSGCILAKMNFNADVETKNATKLSWNWNFGNGQTDTLQSPEPQRYEKAGEYLVSLKVEDAYGCTSSAEKLLTVHSSPAIRTNPDVEICKGSPVQLTVTGATTYTWNAVSSLSCADCARPTATPTETTEYRVTGYNEYGCSAAASVKVNVHQSHSLTLAEEDEICIGQTVELVAGGASHYTWSPSQDIKDPASGVTTATPKTSTRYTVIGRDNLGCFIDTASIYVTVHSSPPVSAGQDMAICRGGSQQLKATGAAFYTWRSAPSLSCTECDNPLAGPTEDAKYIVTGYSAFGCSASDTVAITVHQPFQLRVDQPAEICIGKTARLAATGADQYTWAPSATVADPAAGVTIATPQTSTFYQVTAKDKYNCFTDTASVYVKVWEYPTVEAGEAKTLLVGHSLELTPRYSPDVSKYQWTPANTLNCANCPNPYANPKSETTYTIEASNNGGCKTSASVTIHVICNGGNLFIPNTFSPNNDGRNDRFYLKGVGISRVKSLKVYSRWGEVVFSRENFPANDVTVGWDGTMKGQALAPDVYLYTCEVVCMNNEVLIYNGDVTLIR